VDRNQEDFPRRAYERKSKNPTYASKLLAPVLNDGKVVKSAFAEMDALLKDLNRKAKFEADESSKAPPFLINPEQNMYSVLGDDEGSVIKDDPYNIMIHAMADVDDESFLAGIFTTDKEIFRSEAEKVSCQKVIRYLLNDIPEGIVLPSVRSMEDSNLLKVTNQFVANEYWKRETSIDNTVLPDVNQARQDIAKSRQKKRERNAPRLNITVRRKMLRMLESMVTSDNAGYAHAIVHAIDITLNTYFSDIGKRELIAHGLSKDKRLRPNYQSLELIGVIPKMGLHRYKNLFSPIEWELIECSGYKEFCNQISIFKKDKLSFEKIKPFIALCNKVKLSLKEDRIFIRANKLKTQRLALCSQWKSQRRGESKLNMWYSVGSRWDYPSTKAAFAPGILHIEGKEGITHSPQELAAALIFDRERNVFVASDERIEDFNGKERSLIIEYITLLSSGLG
jgi:hypothetical protein